ncbi:hypothetical protein XF_2415 [Xylella fastidiosa 9a5c]|uniref:Uncharacterized protein n=1 Tax=Xylella fastidiosa (strain 9a5c) TaxID=160492 RepID=Q9PAT0_XYLFA|nr:hypothetical protein XF_2415 [Xylella fastidiosa 9a5c]
MPVPRAVDPPQPPILKSHLCATVAHLLQSIPSPDPALILMRRAPEAHTKQSSALSRRPSTAMM